MARASSPAAAAEPAERERRATDEITSVFEAATAAFQRPTTPCRRAPPFSTTLVAADARRELRPAPLVPIAATALPTFAVDIESLSAPTPRHDEPLRDVTPEARSAVPSIRAPLKLKPVARRLGRLAMFVTVVIVVFGGAAVAAAVSQRAFFAANLVPRAAAVHRTDSDRTPPPPRTGDPGPPPPVAPPPSVPEAGAATSPTEVPLAAPRARHASRPRVKAVVPPPSPSTSAAREEAEPGASPSEPPP